MLRGGGVHTCALGVLRGMCAGGVEGDVCIPMGVHLG